MRQIKIISDSSCDLVPEFIQKHDIGIVPYFVSLDGQTYKKENEEITAEEFYKALQDKNVYPKTSLPPIQNYIDEFVKYLEQGMDILCFTLTSKFSGSYQSAMNAVIILKEEFPDLKIEVVDSQTVTASQGALILEAAKMREAGLTLSEIAETSRKLREHCVMYVTVDSLTYLQKGGRIGKVGAFAGSLLNIKPIIAVRDGELFPLSKVRGYKKALNEIVSLINKDIGDKKDDYITYVLSADKLEDAQEIAESLTVNHKYKLDLPIFRVGVTIGAHIGPTAIGVGYIKKYEKL